MAGNLYTNELDTYAFTSAFNNNSTIQLADHVNNTLEKHEAYMMELIKQYENVTQYLTYAKELENTHGFLGEKLSNEHNQTAPLAEQMRKNVYKIRQRYLEKQSQMFYNHSTATLMQISILFVIVIGCSTLAYVQGAVSRGVWIGILVVSCLTYIIFFYMFISNRMSRNSLDSTKYNFTTRSKDRATYDSVGSCRA